MEKYEKDQTGQWWCYTKRQRVRATEQACQKCGKQFPNRHPQRFCSRDCAAKAVGAACRGVLKVPRGEQPCVVCGKRFLTRQPSQPAKCCSRKCAWRLRSATTKGKWSGEKNPRWSGGIKRHAAGYIQQYVPGRSLVLQHRLVMEQMLGRPLLPKEQVHHKNGIRDDNRPDNLELWVKHQPPGQRAQEQQHCPTCTCFNA